MNWYVYFKIGSVRLDNETYSEPVLYLTALKKWTSLPPNLREKWAKSLGIRVENMKKLATSVDELSKKVNMFLGRKDGKYESESEIQKNGNQSCNILNATALNISHDITPRELNLFRLILTWVSADNIIRQVYRPAESEDTVNAAQISKPLLSVEAMKDLFPTCEMLSIEDDQHWKIGNFAIPLNVHYQGNLVCAVCKDRLLLTVDIRLCVLLLHGLFSCNPLSQFPSKLLSCSHQSSTRHWIERLFST